MGATVGLHLYSVHHEEHGLSQVERVAQATSGLARRLVEAGGAVDGAVVLSTCNRVEIYLDAEGDLATLGALVRAAIAAGHEGRDPGWAEVPLRVRTHTEVLSWRRRDRPLIFSITSCTPGLGMALPRNTPINASRAST